MNAVRRGAARGVIRGRVAGLGFSGLALAIQACGSPAAREVPPSWQGEVTLTIGDPTANTFGSISGLAFAPSGRILVADRLDQRVRVFSPAGVLLYGVGRPGRGPGDLGGPCCLTVKGDTLWIKESQNHRYSAFFLGDTAARFIRMIPGGTNGVWSGDRVDFDSANRLIDLQTAFDAGSGAFRTLRQFRDAAGALVGEDTVPSPPTDSLDLISFGRAGGLTTYYPRFGARALRAFGSGGQSALAVSSRYAVEWRDVRGQRVALLERPITMGSALLAEERRESDSVLVQTAREAGSAARTLTFKTPTHRPPLEELGFDLTGRLWIQHAVAKSVAHHADVYDAGRWVAQASWPAAVYLTGCAIHDSAGLAVGIAEDGEEKVVVLRFRRR